MPAPARARTAATCSLLVLTAGGAGAWAQPASDLARHFGFEDPRVLVVDDGVGPVIAADIDGDGLTDIAAVNNRKSRIELHLQRSRPLSDEEQGAAYRVNDFPPSPWYERKEVSVAHQVTAIAAHDVDGDGKLDLLYAGRPEEIVVLRQGENLAFDILSRRREKGLSATRSGFAVADVVGDRRPELLAVVSGRINVYALSSGGAIGEPRSLGSGAANQNIVAFFCEDFDGDGATDVVGALPDDAAPLRLWMQQTEGSTAAKNGVLGPEVRFEMPALREVEPVRFPGRAAASIGVIERATRRVVFFDLVTERIEAVAAAPGAEREVQAEVRAFPEGTASDRSVAVADIDSDGDLDLIVTNANANQLALFRQGPGGLAAAETFSAFRKPKTVAVGQWDGAGAPEVFVLSEEEKTFGVARVDGATGRIGFPQPISIATAGGTPVAMNYVEMSDGPAIAVVVKDKRDHTLEIHRPGGVASATIALEGVKRPPQSILAADLDHDGRVELLLLTPDEPMVVVSPAHGGAPATVLTDKTMPQFGLVQAAGPDNTALLDIDGDGNDELLIADRNYVRATQFTSAGGWRVIDQITVADPSTAFTGLAVLPAEDGERPVIIASDRSSGRLVKMTPEFGAWRVVDTLRLPGFSASSLVAGAFAGDGEPGLLVLGPDGFGVVRLAGERAALESFAAYRSDDEDRLEHEISVGDVNGDGFVDAVVLDAGRQMCQILTFSAARNLFEATEFEVFQSRLFQGGDAREFEPSDAIVADVTGDGAEDITLVIHDRLIVYPQMTAPE